MAATERQSSSLIRDVVASQFKRGEKSREKVLNLMAGGEEFDAVGHGD
ncbi:hypothetical protein [Paradevosia shaoguanensis]|uniref:Uncharacterized protein n=1 Tax=Paradevosia shaoguanensis TaxID=1335043 RepID=A0AA41UCY6_9HYPH|nr:hypothetical protein [Paradevosia shaoguanensis]MCF1742236.1 hypothetical protein [Paradevosia shaoguanensis]MCI0126719.1 hypothetical protein [Paradevosia shaoguanensis]CDP50755.1 hypothetical protein [Devosia sp. DBB001]